MFDMTFSRSSEFLNYSFALSCVSLSVSVWRMRAMNTAIVLIAIRSETKSSCWNTQIKEIMAKALQMSRNICRMLVHIYPVVCSWLRNIADVLSSMLNAVCSNALRFTGSSREY